MAVKKRQKMCFNCEGAIDLDVIVCPFCAADLREEKPEQQRPSYSAAVQTKNVNMQQSLYPPHYVPKAPQPEEEVEAEVKQPQEEEAKGFVLPILMITLGMQLFLLSVLMLCFSHDGVLHLKWDARFWFFYFLAAAPLIFFGYKQLDNTNYQQ